METESAQLMPLEGQPIAFEPDWVRTGKLVERARSGDFSAFESLYREWVGRIHAICLRMTGDPGQAEELTQAAFVQAWHKLESLRGHREFPAWLKRIAVNGVINDRRARARRREDAMEALFEADDGRGDAPQAIDLEHAIRRLPARAREVFVLHDVEGYRHEDIARMLEIKTGTSKAQLHRARKLLREMLQ